MHSRCQPGDSMQDTCQLLNFLQSPCLLIKCRRSLPSFLPASTAVLPYGWLRPWLLLLLMCVLHVRRASAAGEAYRVPQPPAHGRAAPRGTGSSSGGGGFFNPLFFHPFQNTSVAGQAGPPPASSIAAGAELPVPLPEQGIAQQGSVLAQQLLTAALRGQGPTAAEREKADRRGVFRGWRG
jgi:hypothetical protein